MVFKYSERIRYLFLDLLKASTASLLVLTAIFVIVNFGYYAEEIYTAYIATIGCPLGDISRASCSFDRIVKRAPIILVALDFLSYVMAGSLIFLVVYISNTPFKEILGCHVRRKVLFFYISCTFVYCFVWLLLEGLFSHDSMLSPIYSELNNGGEKVRFALETLIFAPIVEELIFRGYLQKVLVSTFLKTWGGILFSALFFSLVHGYGVFESVSIGIGGVMLGYIRYRTGSLVVPILCHGQVNAIAYLVN